MTPDRADHAQFEELAVRHVSGGLAPHQAQVFRAHLLECAQCRARVGELRAIASDLADVERDERRQRVEEPAEKKRRSRVATREQDPPRAPPDSGGRALLVIGVVFVVLLSVWNFSLRSENGQLEASLDAERRATAIGNLGDRWTPSANTLSDGVARSQDGEIVVLVEDVDDGASYVVELAAGDGDILLQERVTAVDGYVRYLGTLPPAAQTVVVRLPSPAPDANPRDGTIAFEARRSGDEAGGGEQPSGDAPPEGDPGSATPAST